MVALCALASGVIVLGQAAPASNAPPTVDAARAFIARAEETLNTLGVRASRADWVQSTYITADTQAIASETRQTQLGAATQFAKEAGRFRGLPKARRSPGPLRLLALSQDLVCGLHSRRAPSGRAIAQAVPVVQPSLRTDFPRGHEKEAVDPRYLQDLQAHGEGE